MNSLLFARSASATCNVLLVGEVEGDPAGAVLGEGGFDEVEGFEGGVRAAQHLHHELVVAEVPHRPHLLMRVVRLHEDAGSVRGKTLDGNRNLGHESRLSGTACSGGLRQ